MEHNETYKGYEIKILHDESPSSPREWDNLGTIVTNTRRYTLGDENPSDIQEWLENKSGLSFDQQEKLFIKCDNNHKKYMDEIIARAFKECIYLPVFMYDHGNIALSTGSFSCPWDSGQIGFIYIEKAKAKKEFNWKNLNKTRIDKIHKSLECEIKEYSDYINGDVYGYVIKKNEEEIESCWGFIGDYDDYCLKEAKSTIDHLNQ